MGRMKLLVTYLILSAPLHTVQHLTVSHVKIILLYYDEVLSVASSNENDETMTPWTMIILVVLSVMVVLIVITIVVILILVCLIILKKG